MEENTEEKILVELEESVEGLGEELNELNQHLEDQFAIEESVLGEGEEEESAIIDREDEENLNEIIDILNNSNQFNNYEDDEEFNQDQQTEDGLNSTDSYSQENFDDEYFSNLFSIMDRLYTSAPDDDDWDNDNDPGYLIASLSKEEVYEFDDRFLAYAKSRKKVWTKQLEENKKHSIFTVYPLEDSEKSSSKTEESEEEGNEKKENTKSDDPLTTSSSPTNSSPFSSSSTTPSQTPKLDALRKFKNRLRNSIVSSSVEPKRPSMISSEFQNKRQSIGERRRSEIIGQHHFQGVDNKLHSFFNLQIIFEPYKTGFEATKDLEVTRHSIIAGRYEVYDVLGEAAFSKALQCIDLFAQIDEENEKNYVGSSFSAISNNSELANGSFGDAPLDKPKPSSNSKWVCLKVIKNNKDFFDQSLDEVKLLQYINSCGDSNEYNFLNLIDYFYYKEHLFIVSELLKENLYEFNKFIYENKLKKFFTLKRIKKIAYQLCVALKFIHNLKLIHCDIKPENILIKSFSKCEIKLIDFGLSCFVTDHPSSYLQSRSYRAPEVILGNKYDNRIDMWSVGAVLFELYTNNVLFENVSVQTMLGKIISILGPFPSEVIKNCKESNKYFTTNSGVVYECNEDENSDNNNISLIFPKKTNLYKRLKIKRQKRRSENEDVNEKNLFVDFLYELLNLDPLQRITAEEALNHPFLINGHINDFPEYIIQEEACKNNLEGDEEEDEDEDEDDYDDDEEENNGADENYQVREEGTYYEEGEDYEGYEEYEENGGNIPLDDDLALYELEKNNE